MVLSMTGFGRGEADYRGGKIVVEVMTVNSRYLDISVHGLREHSGVEIALRTAAAERMNRGRVNIVVQRAGCVAGTRAVAVDEDLVRAFGKELDRVRWILGINEKAALNVVAARPELIEITDSPTDEGFAETVLAAASAAFEEVLETRRAEGAKLAHDLEQRFDAAGNAIERVKKAAPKIADSYRERLRARSAELAAEAAPDERLDAEVVLFAERSDITEEITRFQVHLETAREAIKTDGRVGRRLEFIVQELHREINTIGSKSQAAEISTAVVEIKEILEQVREQVQNIE